MSERIRERIDLTIKKTGEKNKFEFRQKVCRKRDAARCNRDIFPPSCVRAYNNDWSRHGFYQSVCVARVSQGNKAEDKGENAGCVDTRAYRSRRGRWIDRQIGRWVDR